jgi:hypothetical protein
MSELELIVAAGDPAASLAAIRDRLASELVTAEGSAVAAVAKQLVEVMVRLAALPSGEVSAADDLKRKRDARRAKVSDSPATGVKRRSGSGRAGGKRGAAS